MPAEKRQMMKYGYDTLRYLPAKAWSPLRRRQRNTRETAVSGTDSRTLKACASKKVKKVIGSQRRNRVKETSEALIATLEFPWISPLKPPPSSLVVRT